MIIIVTLGKIMEMPTCTGAMAGQDFLIDLFDHARYNACLVEIFKTLF